jgi:hypothetical protein
MAAHEGAELTGKQPGATATDSAGSSAGSKRDDAPTTAELTGKGPVAPTGDGAITLTSLHVTGALTTVELTGKQPGAATTVGATTSQMALVDETGPSTERPFHLPPALPFFCFL